MEQAIELKSPKTLKIVGSHLEDNGIQKRNRKKISKKQTNQQNKTKQKKTIKLTLRSELGSKYSE